jgi:hypothetical protein
MYSEQYVVPLSLRQIFFFAEDGFEQVYPKRCYLFTQVHGVTFKKKVLFILTAGDNLKFYAFLKYAILKYNFKLHLAMWFIN